MIQNINRLVLLDLSLLLALSLACGCPHGDIRVLDAVGVYQGSLELCIAGRWNRVCGDVHSTHEATVACRQLGCTTSFVAERVNCPASNVIKLKCETDSTRLLECSTLDSTNCSSSGDWCIQTHCSSCTARSDLLPYGGIHGDSEVPMVDDGSSAVITLHHPLTYFGSDETQVYVNTNGVLSFQGSYTAYSPLSLPINSEPLILPFWKDVNTVCGGVIYYRVSTSNMTLEQTSNLIPINKQFYPTSAFIATWNQVAPYTAGSCTSNPPVNTFQAVLMTSGDTSYVCFLYQDINWGGGAQVGFNAGDGNRSFTVPGGLTDDTLNMGSMSNVGRPGVFVYQVNGNEISSPEMSASKPPTQLTVNRVFPSSFELSWNSTQGNTHHYNVYCYHPSCPYCSHLPEVDTVQTTQTAATIVGLYPFTKYGCCVTTVSAYGESNCSAHVTLYTQPVPPTPPVNITVIEVTVTSMQIAWFPPQYTNGSITHYNIACYDDFNSAWLGISVKTSENVTILQPFTNYTCCVSASNTVGAGNSICTETRTLTAPPSEPINITTTSTDTTSLTLIWMEPACLYGQNVLYYCINCTSLFNNEVNEKAYNRSTQVTGLQRGTNYTCCVQAMTLVGFGNAGCIETSTSTVSHLEANINQTMLIAVISGGVLLALLAVGTTCLLICCCFRKSRRKHQQQSITEPVYDIPQDIVEGIEMKATRPTAPNNDKQSSGEEIQQDTCTGGRSRDKEDMEVRYDKRILTSASKMNERKKPTVSQPLNTNASMSTHTTSNHQHSTAQHMVPPRTYKQSLVTEYQNLTIHRGGNGQCEGLSTSDGLYETIGKPEETNLYEPVTFKGETGTQTEGVYQALTRRDDPNPYQDLHIVHT